MSAKIIRLLPHCDNLNLRLINLRLLPPPVPYPMPSECEWNRPGDLIRHAGRIRNHADAARLLSQFSTAAQENLFTIAVDGPAPSLTSTAILKGR